MLEKDLVSKILRWLRANYPGIFCWKVHDMFHAGIPDIVGCWNGIFFGIEVKVKGGRVEKIQTHVIKQIEEAGGVAGVAWSMSDAAAIMERVKQKGGM